MDGECNILKVCRHPNWSGWMENATSSRCAGIPPALSGWMENATSSRCVGIPTGLVMNFQNLIGSLVEAVGLGVVARLRSPDIKLLTDLIADLDQEHIKLGN